MQLTAKEYTADYSGESQSERIKNDAVIRKALGILEKRMYREKVELTSPCAVKDYIRLKLAGLEREVFSAIFLDAQHYVIDYVDMFAGTLTKTSVHPRELVKKAMRLNAAAIIFVHNHPSGKPEPSQADEHLTNQLKSALSLVDVRVLDHLVVGGMSITSFAERGLI